MRTSLAGSVGELARTAAVLAERDDVFAVTIDLNTDADGRDSTIIAWRCENPECGMIHVDVRAQEQERLRVDEETRTLVPVEGEEEEHGEPE